MSKIKNILLESNHIPDEMVDKILNDCSYYFKINGRPVESPPLYRGSDKLIKDYKVITPRRDRKPLDTPIEIHRALDRLFYDKFGWYVRTEGVFAIGKRGSASEYGQPYIMLPIGKFKYVWSPYIYDLHSKLVNTGVIYSRGGNSKVIMEKDEYMPILEELVGKYKDNDLDTVIHTGNEISIKCDKYYIINENYLEISYRELFW
jgi:hypothetical protein